MSLEELKKEYSNLQKKYNLPKFDELDNEFEIRAIEIDKAGILIKAILRMIVNKLTTYVNYLDPITNPNPQSTHSMTELNNTTDAEKDEMFNFFKELSYIYHLALLKELESEQEIANYINEIWKKWPSIKNKEKKFLDIITKAWLKEQKEPKKGYLG